MKTLLSVIYFTIALFFALFASRCQSGEYAIATKDINCNKITQDNGMPCCMMLMTPVSSGNSKDVVCAKFTEDLIEKWRNDRKKENYIFCKTGSVKPDAPVLSEDKQTLCMSRLNEK